MPVGLGHKPLLLLESHMNYEHAHVECQQERQRGLSLLAVPFLGTRQRYAEQVSQFVADLYILGTNFVVLPEPVPEFLGLRNVCDRLGDGHLHEAGIGDALFAELDNCEAYRFP